MWVERAFMTLNVNYVMWKSISSSGWKYFIVWEDLGLILMYVNCVYLIYYYFDNIIVTSEWYYSHKIIIVITKYDLA